jgi:hypothetical protein
MAHKIDFKNRVETKQFPIGPETNEASLNQNQSSFRSLARPSVPTLMSSLSSIPMPPTTVNPPTERWMPLDASDSGESSDASELRRQAAPQTTALSQGPRRTARNGFGRFFDVMMGEMDGHPENDDDEEEEEGDEDDTERRALGARVRPTGSGHAASTVSSVSSPLRTHRLPSQQTATVVATAPRATAKMPALHPELPFKLVYCDGSPDALCFNDDSFSPGGDYGKLY